MGFERIGGETAFDGKIAKVRVDRFRYDDGEEAEREIDAKSLVGLLWLRAFEAQR